MAELRPEDEMEELARHIRESPIRIFAFDFDLTITRIHAYAQCILAADVPKRWQKVFLHASIDRAI